MRDPIERIRSAYQHALWDGVESRSIKQALLDDARYVYRSQYAMQVEQYLAHFPRSQILLITAEQLRHKRDETMRCIYSFIGVDPNLLPESLNREYHSSEGRDKPRHWARTFGDVLIRTHADRFLPSAVERIAVSRFARTPILPIELEIDGELRAQLACLLRKDLESLRGFMGPTFDCWGLLEPVKS